MESIRKYINEKNIIKDEIYNSIKNSITCIICFDIIYEPMMCMKCQGVYCKDCINKWSKEDKKCPNRCINPNYKNSIQISQLLTKIKFECEKCHSEIYYNEMEKHYFSKCKLGKSTDINIEKTLSFKNFRKLDDTDDDNIFKEPEMKLTSK